jgi:sulfur relay (sulfurtransferase) DsrF/TusC family protein
MYIWFFICKDRVKRHSVQDCCINYKNINKGRTNLTHVQKSRQTINGNSFIWFKYFYVFENQLFMNDKEIKEYIFSQKKYIIEFEILDLNPAM